MWDEMKMRWRLLNLIILYIKYKDKLIISSSTMSSSYYLSHHLPSLQNLRMIKTSSSLQKWDERDEMVDKRWDRLLGNINHWEKVVSSSTISSTISSYLLFIISFSSSSLSIKNNKLKNSNLISSNIKIVISSSFSSSSSSSSLFIDTVDFLVVKMVIINSKTFSLF